MCKKFIIAILGFLLSSCVVVHEEYFYPQASGATVEKEWYRGNVGVDNQLVFKLDDVDINIDVWEYKGITHLGVGLKVYDGATVVWPSQIVIVHSDKTTRELEVKSFTRLRRVRGTDELLKKKYPVNSVMANSGMEEYDTYYDSFEMSEESIDKVTVKEIRLLINGKEKTLSALSFTKKSGLFLHPLNC